MTVSILTKMNVFLNGSWTIKTARAFRWAAAVFAIISGLFWLESAGIQWKINQILQAAPSAVHNITNQINSGYTANMWAALCSLSAATLFFIGSELDRSHG